MAKKNEESKSLIDIVGKYVDPADELSVHIVGDTVILNNTQVPAEHIANITLDVTAAGGAVVQSECHPAEYAAALAAFKEEE